MRILFLILLLGLGPAVAAQDANSAPGFEDLDRVHEAAAQHVMRESAPGTTVAVAPLDARLRLPACAGDLQTAATSATTTAANIAVRCAAPAWSVYVPVRVSLRQSVVVLRQGVARGQALAATDVRLEVRDVGQAAGYYSQMEQVIGKTLRRPLTPGSVLSPDVLASPLLVRRGELVTLLGRAGAMEIRTQAKALGDGSQDQAIQVQNTASGRVIGAVVRDSGLVEVNL